MKTFLDVEAAKVRLEEIKYNRPEKGNVGGCGYPNDEELRFLQASYDIHFKQEVDELKEVIAEASKPQVL